MKKTVLLAALVLVHLGAAAQMTYFLTAQWVEGGSRFCKYGNGTVLNVGVNLCPLSIRG